MTHLLAALRCRLTYHQVYAAHGVARCLRCGRTWQAVTE